MEEFFDNIFVQVGLVILGIFVLCYSLYKWILPFIIKKTKERNKIRKNKQDYEFEENYNQVEIVTKDVRVEEMAKEGVELSSKLKEIDYIPEQKEGQFELNLNSKDKQDDEFEAFLNQINNEKCSIKNEIKDASPKLKGVILSGVLQDKKF